MKTAKKLAILALSAPIMLGSVAYAEGFYLGAGLGYTSVDSDPNGIGLGQSGVETSLLGLTGGYRWDQDTYFAAAEIDADFLMDDELTSSLGGQTCSVFADAPYFCSHDSTIRLRGIIGTSIGSGWSVFGTLGYGFAFGDSAVSPFGDVDGAVVGGLTAGIGAQKQLGPGTLRIEFIHDNFSNTIEKPSDGAVTYSPTWEANTLKATYLIKL